MFVRNTGARKLLISPTNILSRKSMQKRNSGKHKHERAHSGVDLLLHKKYKSAIDDIVYVNDKILKVSLRLNKTNLHLISVYTPDISKPREETDVLQ